MKKITSVCVLLILLSAGANGQVLNFNFVQSPVCYSPLGAGAQAFVSTAPAGASYYVWSGSSATSCSPTFTSPVSTASANIGLGNCCGVYTITCTAYNSSSAVISSLTKTIGVTCPNWLTINAAPNGGVLCAGQTGTLTLGGGISYTWAPSGSFSNSMVVTPTTSICYSVAAMNAAGCFINTTACFSVFPTPTVTAVGTTVICAGDTTSLHAFGAISYTWYPGGLTGSSLLVSPAANTCYTVVGSNGMGCTSSAVICVLVNPLPSVGITPGGTVCAGGSYVLAATGAVSYIWSVGATGSSIFTNPLSNTCYSVLGTDANGCSDMASSCVTVMPLPVLSVGNATVCKGSSTVLTVSGALTYSWGVGPTTNTLNVLPLVTTGYTVSGVNANGCIGYNVPIVTVDTTCSDVWPGDANSDGVVSSLDVFEVAFGFGNTGVPRSPGGNAYTSQYANNWAGTITGGKNQCHADCNGSGTIDLSDTVAIFNNYSMTHSFKGSPRSADPDINIVSDNTFANAGMWNKADIVLGSASANVNQVSGVAFDIDLDLSVIDNNAVYLVYTPSFLNAGNQNVQFRKTNLAAQKIYAATARTNGIDVSGNGKIAELYFKVKTGLPDNTIINLAVSNSNKTDKNGTLEVMTTGAVALNLQNNPVGLAEQNNQLHTGLFPNPTNGAVTLYSDAAGKTAYAVSDLLGRQVMKGEFTRTVTVDIGTFQNGTYIIQFDSGSQTSYKKLIVDKK